MAMVGCADKVSERTEAGPEVPSVSRIRDVGKLYVAEMTVSKMGTIEDLRLEDAESVEAKAKAIFNSLKIGERKGAYSYDTYLRAYVDFSRLDSAAFVADSVSRTCRVTLPEVEVEFAGRDVALREEHYRVTGLRSNISASERAQLKEEMNSMLKEEVKRNPAFMKELREQGERNVRAWLSAWLEACGYELTD